MILCERQAQPRPQVCGEFVSASALEELHELGVVPALLGAAEIRRARLVLRERTADAGLPFVAYGLSRMRLDASLLGLAAREAAEVQRGAGVRLLARADGGPWLACSDGRRILTRTVALARGKHELRGHQRIGKPGSGCVGFKMHWRLLPEQEAALGRRIELFLHPHGYAGLQPIDTGMANLCFVMGLTAFQTVGASFAAALSHLRQLIPTLDERLRGANPLLDEPCERRRAALRLCLSRHRLCRRPLPCRRPARGDPVLHGRRHRDRAADRPPRGGGDHGRRALEGFRGDGSAAGALAHARRRFARNDGPAAVFVGPALSFARCAGVLPTLARATRLRARTVGSDSWVGSGR